MRIKICGLTTYKDACLALDAGAGVLGFVLAESPRRMTPQAVREIRRRLPPLALVVGVLVAPEEGFALSLLDKGVVDRLQVHQGRVNHPLAYPSAAEAPEGPLPPLLHLDTATVGGTGKCADWDLASHIARRTRVILAGGLTPANVTEAIGRVRPFGVDASSGVESSPGKKDPSKVREFCDAALRA